MGEKEKNIYQKSLENSIIIDTIFSFLNTKSKLALKKINKRINTIYYDLIKSVKFTNSKSLTEKNIKTIQKFTSLKKLIFDISIFDINILTYRYFQNIEELELRFGIILNPNNNKNININYKNTKILTITKHNEKQKEPLDLFFLKYFPNITDLNIFLSTNQKLENYIFTYLTSDFKFLENINIMDVGDKKSKEKKDIDEFPNIINLKTLNISDYKIKINKMSILTKLLSLNLFNTNLDNLNFVGKLENLEEIDISNNNSLRSIYPLLQLNKLTSIKSNKNYQINYKNFFNSNYLNATNIKKLEFSFCGLNNIDFITIFRCLEELDISENRILDLKKLKKLTELKILKMRKVKPEKINFLKHLINLEILSMEYNECENSDKYKYEKISELTNFKELYINNNGIKNIDFLSELTNLEILFLQNNIIKDISALENLTNIKKLNLFNTGIKDISILENMESIEYLEIRNNNITDLTCLENLRSLEELYIEVNYKIKNLKFLKKLKNLKKLGIYGCKLINDQSIWKKLKFIPEIIKYNS